MNVLHINCNYLGTALHQTMIEHLSTLDVNSTVFVPIHKKTDYSIRPASNVTVSECFKKMDRVIFQYKNSKIYNSVKKKLNINQFDLVHAYTLFTDGYVAYKIKKEYNKPYVVAIRNTDVNDFFKHMIHLRKLGIRIMQEASAIFFLSPSYKKQVFEKYVPNFLRKELESKCFIIPNGIDDYWFDNLYQRQKTIDTKKIKIVFAGKIDKNKNIELTLKSLDLLKAKGYKVHFTAVGNVIDKRVYRLLMDRNDTTYIPAKPKEELISIYRDNDIFVMPSHTESFGLVYAEAMSQALPVIYTKNQGFDSQFAEGEIGFHVSAIKPDSCVRAIQMIIKCYDKISNRCPNAAQKFNWNSICKQYAEIYMSVLAAKL